MAHLISSWKQHPREVLDGYRMNPHSWKAASKEVRWFLLCLQPHNKDLQEQNIHADFIHVCRSGMGEQTGCLPGTHVNRCWEVYSITMDVHS